MQNRLRRKVLVRRRAPTKALCCLYCVYVEGRLNGTGIDVDED